MSIFIYKRTHIGDPNPQGVFGIQDCMGKLRDLEYEAVIGIGGIGSEPRSYDIAGRITWVGVHPTKEYLEGKRNPLVTFKNFLLFDKNGPIFRERAPLLARRMYEGGARYLLNGYTEAERWEAERIIEWVVEASKDASGEEEIEYDNYRIHCVCRK